MANIHNLGEYFTLHHFGILAMTREVFMSEIGTASGIADPAINIALRKYKYYEHTELRTPLSFFIIYFRIIVTSPIESVK